MTQADDSEVRFVLPRGRHAAPRQVVFESQRERMLGAIVGAVAEKGYARVAVADVIERAGVSRKTFYEHFENKEQCFLAAYDTGVDLLLDAIDEVTRAAHEDPTALAVAATRCYLDALVENPDFARTYLVEILAAGPAAIERRRAVHERFARQLARIHRAVRAGAEPLPAAPDHVFRACVGAVDELVTDALTREGPRALPRLLEPILDIQARLLLLAPLAAHPRR